MCADLFTSIFLLYFSTNICLNNPCTYHRPRPHLSTALPDLQQSSPSCRRQNECSTPSSKLLLLPQLLLHVTVLLFFTLMFNIAWNVRKKYFLSNLNQLIYLYYDITLYGTLISKEPLPKHADRQAFMSKGLGVKQPSTQIVLFKPALFLFLCLQNGSFIHFMQLPYIVK